MEYAAPLGLEILLVLVSFHEPSGGFDLWLENHSVFFGELLQPALFGLHDSVVVFL
jgi:hypothetical protein